MEQINKEEQSSINDSHKNVDNYASLFDDITVSAIRNSQKKVRELTDWVSSGLFEKNIIHNTPNLHHLIPFHQDCQICQNSQIASEILFLSLCCCVHLVV